MNRNVSSKAPAVLRAIVTRLETLPTWGICALIAGSVLLVSWLFLWPSFSAFPMDDTYVHFVYARNLAEQGRLVFNFADEKGVGTTSILWVLLLAAGWKLGISLPLLAKALGIASLVVVGIGLYSLLRPLWRPLPAFLASLFVVISGNMIWFALSGMETVLFLAVGVLALLAYRRGRWAWLGVALGLLALIRPEGLALGLAVAIAELFRERRLRHGPVLSALIFFLICAPWFGYLLWRTGIPVSTSGIGKQLSSSVALSYILDGSGAPAALNRFAGLIYIGSWVGYLLLFNLGGMALPPPHVSVGTFAANSYSISVWSIAAWAVAILLLFVAARKLTAFDRWRSWMQDDVRRTFLVLMVWDILHNLCYMLFLPVPGTASRYGALNYVVLWLALVAGLLTFVRFPRLVFGLAGALMTVAFANTLYWNGVYDANLDHMHDVRIMAARFVRDTFPSRQLCAAYDVGALRYYSQRPILDLGGLIDPSAVRVFESGAADQYLLDHGVSCLVLPGRTGRTDEGWFDFARILGLTTSRLIKLHLVNAFEIDRRRWLQGYLPTVNYQASVTVYRVEKVLDSAP
jgi:hypothetical protein